MNDPKLRDTFARRINYLRVSVTDRCNLRCTYCMPEQGIAPLTHGQILSYEEIVRVVRIALGVGIRKVRITGGEPLVRKSITGLVEQLAALEGLEDLSLTTNGILLGPMAQELARAGLRRVNVSLDTLRPDVFEKITRRSGLAEVMDGLKAATAAGLDPVKINVVAIRGVNDGEIVDFARFAQRGGYEVRFIEFMPSREEEWRKADMVTADEILTVLRDQFALEPVTNGKASGPERAFRLPGGGKVGVISPLSNHFCNSCNRLRLTADGKLRSCLFSSRETDLLSRLREDADDDAIAEMLNQAVLQKPEGHALHEQERGKCGMTMSRIGG